MANTFKNAKVVNVNGSGSPDTLYTVPSSTTTIVLSLNLCNKNAASRTVTVSWTDGSDTDASTALLNEVAIPGDTTLEVLSGQKIVLMATDALKVVASAGTSIDATLSYMEIT